MSLVLYYHPLASFCQKVLMALYENDTPFEARFVDLADDASSAEMLSFWPVGKIPVLRDQTRGETVPETSIIIEYLAKHHPGRESLVPNDEESARNVRLWDRFFDLYVSAPMQKIVTDRIRPAGQQDAFGVAEAREMLRRSYQQIEQRMASRIWVAGELSMADCAAAPALFYASIVEPFSDAQPNTAAYFERLFARPSFARVIAEARPYFDLFPYRDAIPARMRC